MAWSPARGPAALLPGYLLAVREGDPFRDRGRVCDKYEKDAKPRVVETGGYNGAKSASADWTTEEALLLVSSSPRRRTSRRCSRRFQPPGALYWQGISSAPPGVGRYRRSG